MVRKERKGKKRKEKVSIIVPFLEHERVRMMTKIMKTIDKSLGILNYPNPCRLRLADIL